MTQAVSLDLAKLLKKSRFTQATTKYYQLALTSKKSPDTQDYEGAHGWKKGQFILCDQFFINDHPGVDFSSQNWYMCSAPTIAQVVMWIYDTYDIWINVYQYKDLGSDVNDQCTFRHNFSLEDFNKPLLAYTAAITHVLQLIIAGKLKTST